MQIRNKLPVPVRLFQIKMQFSKRNSIPNSELNSVLLLLVAKIHSMTEPKPLKIFVVEDDDWYRKFIAYTLKLDESNEVKTFATGKELLGALDENPDVITIDYSLPDYNGQDLVKRIKDYNSEIIMVIISGQEEIETAVELLKLGARDYVVKNDETRQRLLNTMVNIKKTVEMREEISSLKEEIGKKYDFSKTIIGESAPIRKVFKLIEKACKSKITVSITGETGTGKEVVAKAIHYSSTLKDKPFVPVNVSAIPKDLIESELFGHEKGAFTGAVKTRIGKFEEAANGTIFLDEIGELDISLQAKLLRVLQERELNRVGGNKTIPVKARVIVATHRNLINMVKTGEFREDLYYRLLGLPIELPPLRERDKDVILVASQFVKDYCRDNENSTIKLSTSAKTKLLSYPFPGNIRELKAVIELACVMCDENTIEADDIIFNSPDKMQNVLTREMTLREYQAEIVKNYLEKYNNNVIKVSKKLDIGKSTIYRMIKSGDVVIEQT